MKRSGIVTLLTDFGLGDPYVAMMKGVIFSINPEVKLVDVTHSIRHGAILEGASVISETFPFYPKGTVHLAVVDPGVGSNRRPICLAAEGHMFVGPDNGIFSLIIKNYDVKEIIHLKKSSYFLPRITSTFHGRDIFAPMAAHLSLGDAPSSMGVIIEDAVILFPSKPRISKDVLIGQVARVDNFGNLITNINKEELFTFLKSKKPIINVGDLTIKDIKEYYSEVDSGEVLALVNSSDQLEIAVCLGMASEYVGLSEREIIGAEVKIARKE
ncbi:S-adenosyl-l-methionine hydroxide adenosyltransferase family protein [Thermodesulfobacteriota bacterium]